VNDPTQNRTWQAPPNWPSPPAGWTPPAGWEPDSAWGPAPVEWQFWPSLKAEPPPLEIDPEPPSSPPATASADAILFGRKSSRRAAKVLPRLADYLDAGESVRAFFVANSLQPMADFVAITNSRVLAGSSAQLDRPPIVSINGADIADVEVSSAKLSRTPKISLTTPSGSIVSVTRLLHIEDSNAFRHAADQLAADPGPRINPGTIVRPPARLGTFPDTSETTGSDGVPEKAISLEADARELLNHAAEACNAGDIVDEEHTLIAVVRLAERVPMMSRREVRRWLRSLIEAETRAHRIRRGARALGEINALGIGADDLQVFSDRFIRGRDVRVLDAQVSAAVELDGAVVVSHRPTLTRMAVGSVLPGSALIPGMAFQKKQKSDTRTATFILAHPEWTLSVRISPDSVSKVRPLALQINRIADELRATAAAPAVASSGQDTLSRLERIGQLVKDGVITTDQATTLRDDLLRNRL
jgi:hypothetical protein